MQETELGTDVAPEAGEGQFNDKTRIMKVIYSSYNSREAETQQSGRETGPKKSLQRIFINQNIDNCEDKTFLASLICFCLI